MWRIVRDYGRHVPLEFVAHVHAETAAGALWRYLADHEHDDPTGLIATPADGDGIGAIGGTEDTATAKRAGMRTTR